MAGLPKATSPRFLMFHHQVLRIRTAQKERLVRGSWVRMKRNDDYKDDLAQVGRVRGRRA